MDKSFFLRTNKKVSLYKCCSRWLPVLKYRDENFPVPRYAIVFEVHGSRLPFPRSSSNTWPPTEEDLCTPSLLDGHHWLDFLEKIDNITDRPFKESSFFFTFSNFELVYNNQKPKDQWRHEWRFVAVDDMQKMPECVDRNGPSLVLLPFGQQEDQAAPVTEHDVHRPKEFDKETVAHLRKEGKTDDEIVFDLMEANISPAKAGELVFPLIQHTKDNPSREDERDAYRKRAIRACEREKKKRGL